MKRNDVLIADRVVLAAKAAGVRNKRECSNKTGEREQTGVGGKNKGRECASHGRLNDQIVKKYLASSSACMVTFRLGRKAARNAKKVTVVGDFTGWDRNAMPMRRLKNGEFKLDVKLQANSEYRFRYLIDDCHWENDWAADAYVPNPYGGHDSVVIV